MTKKGKFNGLVKGAVVGVSLMLCASVFPVSALVSLADTATTEATTAKSFKVDANVKFGGVKLNSAIGKVTKGDRYYIPTATFNGSSVTDVTVRYKNSTLATEAISDNDRDGLKYFEAGIVGTYVVTYTVKEGDKTYSYDYEVECQVGDVVFEFNTNSEDIIPAIYDISLLSSKEETKNKDIVLPIPTVKDENDEVVTFADGMISNAKQNTTENQLVITLSTGVEGVKIEKNAETGKFFIDGDALCKKNEDGNYVAEGVYKINYTLYQNGVFVSQTTKEFEVEESHFQVEGEKDKSGFTLSADYASSEPTSAVTGVMKELPKIKAKATESTESDDIDVFYTIEVYHLEETSNGKDWVKRTEECLDKDNQHEFTAFQNGNYKIEYVVNDFYNHTVKPKNLIYFNDVEDTIAPTVFAYNGDTKNNVDEKGEDFEYRIKSRQSNRNLIVYAIGAEDNVKNENMVLKREIRDVSNITRVEINDYHDKNLIFLPKASKDGESVYEQIVSDNYYLARDMAKDGVTIVDGDREGNESKIKAWLIEHNYLIVTNDFNVNPVTNAKFGNEFFGDIITDSSASGFDLKKVKDKIATEGFAYVSYSKDYNFTQQQYSLHYTAIDDAKNDTKDVYYTVNLSSDNAFTDQDAPSLKFSSDLPTTVLPTDKLEFEAPVASDTQDSRPNMVFAYRYLTGKNGVGALTSEDTKEIAFSNKSISDGANKWYNTEINVSSEGWIMLDEENDNKKFEIDIAKDLKKDAFAGAKYLEIFAYAEDDYGNLGFFSRSINIAQQTEESTLELFDVDMIEKDVYEANSSIPLPTLYYTDTFVEYMTADVTVYYLDTGAKIQSYDMKTSADKIREIFVVEGGEFVASRSGEYQVVITARDAGGNEYASFFDYTVTSNGEVEDPVIDNISADTINMKVDEEYNLPAPTIAFSDSKDYDYYGVIKEEDVNISTYYTPKMISSSNNDYKLTQTHFTPRSSGEYTLAYDVFLIRYNKANDFSETEVDGKLTLDNLGRLVYVKDADNKYFVFYDMKTKEIIVSKDLQRPTDANSIKLNDLGNGVYEFNGIKLTKYVYTSDPQTFKVSEISSPVITVDEDYFSINNVKDGKIEIPNISATVEGKGSLDFSKSKIEISVARGVGTTILQTINCDKLEDINSEHVKYEGGKLYLYLKFDGTYSIKYTAQAQNAIGEAVADPSSKTFTIANGDIKKPKIKVNDGFLNRGAEDYSLSNNDLVLNVSALEFEDNESSVDYLKKHYSITVRNSTTNNEVTRVGEGDTYNYTLTTAGEYEIIISVTDVAGWTTERTVTIKVMSDDQSNVEVYKVVGTILIVVSVVVLAGVVTYFIVSKVKQDKKGNKTR